jgi:hypothetical protein
VPDDLTATLNAQACILLYLIDETTTCTEQWLAARQSEQPGQ